MTENILNISNSKAGLVVAVVQSQKVQGSFLSFFQKPSWPNFQQTPIGGVTRLQSWLTVVQYIWTCELHCLMWSTRCTAMTQSFSSKWWIWDLFILFFIFLIKKILKWKIALSNCVIVSFLKSVIWTFTAQPHSRKKSRTVAGWVSVWIGRVVELGLMSEETLEFCTIHSGLAPNFLHTWEIHKKKS